MSMGLAFWIIMLVWFVFGAVGAYNTQGNWQGFGGTVALFILLALLGWAQFGAPIH